MTGFSLSLGAFLASLHFAQDRLGARISLSAVTKGHRPPNNLPKLRKRLSIVVRYAQRRFIRNLSNYSFNVLCDATATALIYVRWPGASASSRHEGNRWVGARHAVPLLQMGF